MRLFVLVKHCFDFHEPFLLVGETGCGKTTVCQILSSLHNKNLNIVNAHASTETSDLIGSMRPVREKGDALKCFLKKVQEISNSNRIQEDGDFWDQLNSEILNDEVPINLDTIMGRIESQLKESPSSFSDLFHLRSCYAKAKSLFIWKDGPLIDAMRSGDCFLLDEISLADDSVLERLNSLLESDRTLVLAEKGSSATDEVEVLKADESFAFMATMNPGGDYGSTFLTIYL